MNIAGTLEIHGAVLPTKKLGKTKGKSTKNMGKTHGKPSKNGGLMWIDVDFTCKKGGNNWANWDGLSRFEVWNWSPKSCQNIGTSEIK